MLSVLFVVGSVNIVFAENERYSEEKIQESLGILKTLEILPDDYTEDMVANQEVTRAEFAYYAVRLIRFLYKGIIINHNKKLSQPTLKRRFFKKKAAFFSWPGLGKEWC